MYDTLWYIFSCKKGELFDYLTQVVTLSEKRTRFVKYMFLKFVFFILLVLLDTVLLTGKQT